jgi:hypothetical protein
MKADITGNLSFDALDESLKNIFQNIANTILKFPSNRQEVLERLQNLIFSSEIKNVINIKIMKI